MILDFLATIAGEYRSFDDETVKTIMQVNGITERADIVIIVSGRVTTFYRVIR